MIFNTNFSHHTTKENWKIFTALSIVFYILISLTDYTEWNNYFLISLILGVQIYFFVGRQKEKYIFSTNQLIVQFLWIKKIIRFDSFSINENKVYNDEDSHQQKFESQQILLFNNNKQVFRFNKDQDSYLFDEIIEYLKSNVNKINSISSKTEKFTHKRISLIYLICISFITVFCLGYFIESLNPNPDSIKEVKGTLAYQPTEHIENTTRSKSSTYRIRLEEYPKDFYIHTENYPLTNRDKILNAKDSITLYVSRNNYDHVMNLKSLKYFQSHFTPKSIEVIKVKYQNEFILNGNLDGETNKYTLLILLIPFVILIHCLTKFNKIYS